MSEENLPFDPQRRLCLDGACVGVLDHRGACQACGRDWGPGNAATPGMALVPNTTEDDAEAENLGGFVGGTAALGGDEGAFDPGRRLCADGACLGVILADGRCSVCRRPAGALAQG